MTGAREVSRVTAKKEAVVEAAERDAHEPTAGRGAKEKIKVESGKVAAPERARELRRASAEADRLERVARAAADRLRAAERRLADAQRDADAARAVVESAQASAREARERADLARREAESGDRGRGRR